MLANATHSAREGLRLKTRTSLIHTNIVMYLNDAAEYAFEWYSVYLRRGLRHCTVSTDPRELLHTTGIKDIKKT